MDVVWRPVQDDLVDHNHGVVDYHLVDTQPVASLHEPSCGGEARHTCHRASCTVQGDLKRFNQILLTSPPQLNEVGYLGENDAIGNHESGGEVCSS